jgi:hypothetical protein
MVETDAALAAIAANPWTAIIVSHDGQIAEAVPLSAEPTGEGFLDFARTRAKGRRFRLVRQATLSKAELDRMIAALVRPNEPARSWKAEPSVLTEKHFWAPLGVARGISELIALFIARRWR